MNRKIVAVGLCLLIVASVVVAYSLYANNEEDDRVRVACIGDSLTQSTEYPFDLWNLLGNQSYYLYNFGAGSTTVLRSSETPYMNASVFKEALEFQPNIVIIMLGTNDAQPSLHQYNGSFVGDYLALVDSFKSLASKPEIWIVLPPPIFSNQSGKIDPAYFGNTIIPFIEKAANASDLPIINVYSALVGFPNYFPDGVHPNSAGAKIIADAIYENIKK